MRIVRLVALFLGAGLIVAVAAGYVARSAELARDRDLRVATAAEVAAMDLRSAVGQVDTVARLAATPDAALEALDTPPGRASACAVLLAATSTSSASAVCGDGSDASLASLVLDLPDRAFTVVDGAAVMTAVGPDVAVAVSLPLDGVARPSSLAVAERVVVDVVPGDSLDGASGVFTEGDRRQSAQPIVTAPGWSVVASLPDEIALDPAERLLFVILLVLAVLLLGLAGFTLVAEHRNLRERATIDPLTRLPNRSEFEHRGTAMVQNALRSGEGVCLMLVDLDGFKEINDTYGHQAGDEVLQVVGKRLRAAVRGYDVVARWGGDEFVLVLPGIDNDVFATSRATSLTKLVSEPMRTSDAAGVGLRVGASVGIALLGDHGETLDELVEAADAAMYAAKRQGETFRMAEPPAGRSDAEFAGRPS